MPKQPRIDPDKMAGLFKRTEPEPGAHADLTDLGGNIRSTGIGLTTGEIAAMDAIGGELGEFMDSEAIARNALMRLAVRRFIEAYRAGEISLQELAEKFERPDKPQPKLKL